MRSIAADNSRWFSSAKRLALAVLAAALSAQAAAAVQLTTDAERSYSELRRSSDTRTQLMAQRWFGLIRLQEWTDISGKFKTRAKYLDHDDPALAWVKLRVVSGTGAERTVKDVTIPLDKLSKTSQSRVRQIAFLRKKVEEAVAAEKKAAESAGEPGMLDSPDGSRDFRGEAEYDAGLTDTEAGTEQEFVGRDFGSPPERDVSEGSFDRGSEPGPTTVGSAGPPLPAMLPPLPSDPALAHFQSAAPGTDSIDSIAEPPPAQAVDPRAPRDERNDPPDDAALPNDDERR